MDNTISHTICIDTEKLTDIRNIENKLKKEISKTYRELMVEILSKKEEEIFESKNILTSLIKGIYSIIKSLLLV